MESRQRKRAQGIYWTATAIVCGVMVFSAINFNLENPVGPMKGAFAHLGFPDYFRIELTAAKALGVLALLMPGVPTKVREFAYAGFAITLVSASVAHFSSGDSLPFVIDPLLFLGALIVSYVYFHKIHRVGAALALPPFSAYRVGARQGAPESAERTAST
jgi:DoxX-like protein